MTAKQARIRSEMPWERFRFADIYPFASELLRHAGLTSVRSKVIARVLLEADLMGHSTHGLQLLAPYLGELRAGRMRVAGEPIVIANHPSSFTWDGQYLPGPWLVSKAMAEAFQRSATQPVVTAVIRRSHHIGCLAAYLKKATDRGLVMLLSCSDPSVASVAPFGGHAGRYTPNPIAAGFPTGRDPVLIDICASTTTNGMVGRMHRSGDGERLPGPWLVDNQGRPSDDPAVMFSNPPGAILPLGGADLGYKGFALGLLVEALTSALAGHGRANEETRWGASVFLQIINPSAFGGTARFERETGWLARACRSAPVKAGQPPVRLPGERALALRAQQMRSGIGLHPEVMQALSQLAKPCGLHLPPACRPRP